MCNIKAGVSGSTGGGTFTDIVALAPDGALSTAKLLSQDPSNTGDASVRGIRQLLGVDTGAAFPASQIGAIRMGTTVATNALLERRGQPTLLAITKGFADALQIGSQNRPRLFELAVTLPPPLHDAVIEIDERVRADGAVDTPLNQDQARAALESGYGAGYRAVAIVLMHGYRHHGHEEQLAAIARAIGFEQICTSHQTDPLMKLVPRGQTTVANAYLTPVLRHYVDDMSAAVAGAPLYFMQSSGGLARADAFEGKDAVLSGPAGGVIGAVAVAQEAGYDKLIGFDMGGTSTDVMHYAGALERSDDAMIAGCRLRVPMLAIHTVAAGGGSVLGLDGWRTHVGPQSAGAVPGPACYGQGGPLAVTDCHVLLGRLQPAYFPAMFGTDGRQPLNLSDTQTAFAARRDAINQATGQSLSTEGVAEGYLDIAVEVMARAVKTISTERGHDIRGHVLISFGGAGGQLACRVAERLGVRRVLIHPLAGLLSALGIGLAAQGVIRERAMETPLDDGAAEARDALIVDALAALHDQGAAGVAETQCRAHLKYAGADSTLDVAFDTPEAMRKAFEAAHHARFGFAEQDRAIIIERLEASASVGGSALPGFRPPAPGDNHPIAHHPVWVHGGWRDTPFYRRARLGADAVIDWAGGYFGGPQHQHHRTGLAGPCRCPCQSDPGACRPNPPHGVGQCTRPDPAGTVQPPLHVDRRADGQRTGQHRPFGQHQGAARLLLRHLRRRRAIGGQCAAYAGASGVDGRNRRNPDPPLPQPQARRCLRAQRSLSWRHAPARYHGDKPGVSGGSGKARLLCRLTRPSCRYRRHHARVDACGLTHIDEEGIRFEAFPLLEQGRLREAALKAHLAAGPWPARKPAQNIADLKAQLAANARGIVEVRRMCAEFGADVVAAYMGHIQHAAEAAVRRAIGALKDGACTYPLDNGAVIDVKLSIDRAARAAVIDFTGSSAQGAHNFNAPLAITRAAVLYAFRCLVDTDIPLNAGCLKPIRLIVPEGSILNPRPPAAVVAGNVETSQAVTNALFLAMGVVAASQGTMNNLSFGNDAYQYYETLGGGTGAGPGFDGASAVHSHMTNSRLTDPEVLEWRYPVLVENFRVRRG